MAAKIKPKPEADPRTKIHRKSQTLRARPAVTAKPAPSRKAPKQIQSADPKTPISDLRALRRRLGLTQQDFTRLFPISLRTLSMLEAGQIPQEAIARRFKELSRLTHGLAEVIHKHAIGNWLLTPNPAFHDLKPLEVIERGESDRIWSMIYFLRSGSPT